jgi:predicted Zn-dependent protease
MIDGIIYGEDPKQGFVENSVFYHPVLKFQFGIPQQWAVQNTPQAVQMAQPDGKAMMMMTLAQGNSLENAAQTMLQNYQLTVLESKQDQVNGLPAIKLVADQVPQQQQGQPKQQASVRVLIYLIQYGGNIYSLLGASAPKDFNSFARVFQGSMESFRELTDPSKLNKQPQRIHIKEVPQNGSLRQALRSFNTKEDRMEELATLNGMTLNENVQRGQLIKTVQ